MSHLMMFRRVNVCWTLVAAWLVTGLFLVSSAVMAQSQEPEEATAVISGMVLEVPVQTELVAGEWVISPRLDLGFLTQPAWLSLQGPGTPMAATGEGFQMSPLLVGPEDHLRLRVQASPVPGGVRRIRLSLGGREAVWQLINRVGDAMPDQLKLRDYTDLEPGRRVGPITIQVSGIDRPVQARLQGPGNPRFGRDQPRLVRRVETGDTLEIYADAPTEFDQRQRVTLQLGERQQYVLLATRARDDMPGAFGLQKSGVAPTAGGRIQTLPVMVDGFDGPLPLILSGDGSPLVSVNGGLFQKMAYLRPGDSILLSARPPGRVVAQLGARQVVWQLSDSKPSPPLAALSKVRQFSALTPFDDASPGQWVWRKFRLQMEGSVELRAGAAETRIGPNPASVTGPETPYHRFDTDTPLFLFVRAPDQPGDQVTGWVDVNEMGRIHWDVTARRFPIAYAGGFIRHTDCRGQELARSGGLNMEDCRKFCRNYALSNCCSFIDRAPGMCRAVAGDSVIAATRKSAEHFGLMRGVPLSDTPAVSPTSNTPVYRWRRHDPLQ